ncbi:hypothetical protein CC79DRAFT_1379475 [Sarocladium strictum]
MAALWICLCLSLFTSPLLALPQDQQPLNTEPVSTLSWFRDEVDLVTRLKSRLVGSDTQDELIDHIQSELEDLEQEVLTDLWNFTYYDGPFSPPTLDIEGAELEVTSWVPYSGVTGHSGVTGWLVNLVTPNSSASPDWEQARGAIAVTNITNVPFDPSILLSVWPDSLEFGVSPRVPEFAAQNHILPHLVGAARAGVKAVIYIWEEAPIELVRGQYVAHENLFSGVPAIFVQDLQSAKVLLEAANRSAFATVTLHGEIVPGRQARTIYTIFEGTELKNESAIIETHTDGFNAVEENGHIALLAQARHLAANPPRRTTIMVFIGSHLHFPAFSPPPFRGTSRWLSEHPELWAGNGNADAFAFGGQLKGVVSSSVEHLGAVHFEPDIEADTYTRTNDTEPEVLGASTPELNDLVREYWVGADPDVLRVTNPNEGAIPVPGENYPFFLAAIPNVFLITAPDYLLKIWPEDFDEKELIDLEAMQRQVIQNVLDLPSTS